MTQRPVEMILLRHWASYMAIPTWITDVDGNLVYYNEPAEGLLGLRFDEVGQVNAKELADRFVTTGLDGKPIPTEDLPIVVALTEHRPAHLKMRIKAANGSWRRIEVTALPLEGQGQRTLGAMAMFWESPSE